MSKTVKEILDYVDEVKPNAFTAAQKVNWLTQIERRIQLEIYLDAEEDLVGYNWDDDQNTEVLTDSPYDGLYTYFLAAMIDFAHGEYSPYQADMSAFNEMWGAFSRYYARRFAPANREDAEALHFQVWTGGDF